MKAVKLKLTGHYNYYGVLLNYESLDQYYKAVKFLLSKWLNRRSQKRSYNPWTFEQMWNYFNIPRPKITGYKP